MQEFASLSRAPRQKAPSVIFTHAGLMAMAGIYWDRQNYKACESVFRNSAEFCSEHEVWRLNVAHTFFMQDNHYKEAI
eukprot:scaffold285157_cov14-Tisochrysis_lutea.AAC.3